MFVSGTVEISDQDYPPQGYVLSIESNNSPFYLQNQVLHVANGLALDHELHPEVSIQVKVTELATGLSLVENFKVKVSDVPESPCCLTIDGEVETDIVESTPIGQIVGQVKVQDQDIGDHHTFNLVNGHGYDVEYFR